MITKKDLNSVRLEFEVRFRNIERTLELLSAHFKQRNVTRFHEVYELQERCEDLEKLIKNLAKSKRLKKK